MRKQTLSSVRTRAARPAALAEQLGPIARQLADYLVFYLPQGRSKHAVMGPIGKALERAATSTPDALLGYTIQIHEMSTRRPLPAGAMGPLEGGLRDLVQLLKGLDEPQRHAALEQIEDAVFYHRRARSLRHIASVMADFQQFAVERYGDQRQAVEALNSGKPLPYPKRTVAGEPTPLGRLVAEFYESRVGQARADALDDEAQMGEEE